MVIHATAEAEPTTRTTLNRGRTLLSIPDLFPSHAYKHRKTRLLWLPRGDMRVISLGTCMLPVEGRYKCLEVEEITLTQNCALKKYGIPFPMIATHAHQQRRAHNSPASIESMRVIVS